MQFLLKLVGFLSNDVPLTVAIITHAVWTRDKSWIWFSAFVASMEMGLQYRMHLRRRTQGLRDVHREVFARYPLCDFRQVSMREYFSDSPGLFEQLLKELPQGRQASSFVGKKLESASGEIMGVPHVLLAEPKFGSPKPTPVPTPTAFDTPDGGWIVTSVPPQSLDPLTRFLMLHEIGHHVGEFVDQEELVSGSVWDMCKISIAIAIAVPITVPNVLVGLALLWMFICQVIEYEVDGPANEVTCEVRADEFAIDRIQQRHLSALLKMFSFSRDRAPKEKSLARTGYLRWEMAAEKCLHRLGTLKMLDEWRLGSGPAPKFNIIPIPLPLMTLSIQTWRWPSPPLMICKSVAFAGAIFLVYEFLRGLSVWRDFTKLRRTRAPFNPASV